MSVELTHLVTAWNLWIAREYDREVPALCGEVGDFYALVAEDGHDRFGSAPEQMCPYCIQVSDIQADARENRERTAVETVGGAV